jgi:hypothetical protein
LRNLGMPAGAPAGQLRRVLDQDTLLIRCSCLVLCGDLWLQPTGPAVTRRHNYECRRLLNSNVNLALWHRSAYHL